MSVLPRPQRRSEAARRGFLGAALLGFACCCSAQGTPPPFDNFDEGFDTAIERAATDQGIRLDPQVAADIKHEAGIFMFNFCAPESMSDETSGCRVGLGTADTLAELIGQYLQDSLTNTRDIETVASRLAHRAGTDIARAGWPGIRDKLAGFVRIPPALHEASISIQTATGATELIGRGPLILANAGHSRLIVTDESGATSTVDLELQAATETAWANSGGPVLGRIGISRESYCTGAAPPLTQALYDFNWGRALLDGGQDTGHTIPVARQPALDIRIEDESGDCNDECELGLGIAFARAVAIWRSGCGRCGKQALSSIRVGSNVWLDRRAMQRLRSLDANAPANPALELSTPAISDVVLATAPSLSAPTVSSLDYEQINADSDIGRKLCSLESAQLWVLGAQAMLCGAEATIIGDELHPILRVRPEPTDCGEEAIACGFPGGLVQLSTQQYAFSVDAPSGPVRLGASEDVLNAAPVVLHEVGHWFGVPHPEQVNVAVKDVMAGRMDIETTCLSSASLTMMNNASDDRWE